MKLNILIMKDKYQIKHLKLKYSQKLSIYETSTVKRWLLGKDLKILKRTASNNSKQLDYSKRKDVSLISILVDEVISIKSYSGY